MTFVKGQSGNPNGRGKGTTNLITRTVKETVLAVFNELQTDPKAKLSAWGKENPTEFYKIASKLIPTEITGDAVTTIRILQKEVNEKEK